MNDAKIWKHVEEVSTTPTPWLVTVDDWEDGPYLVVVWACTWREADSLAVNAYNQHVATPPVPKPSRLDSEPVPPPDGVDTDAVPLQKAWHWIGKALT